MSLRPTTALPPLAGLGIHAHAVRPDGSRAHQYGVATWLVWTDTAAWIEHEGLRIDVNPAELTEAADSMASFVAARGHRKLHALTGLLDLITARRDLAAALDVAIWGEVAA